MQCKTIQCNGIKSSSSENTLICLCIQSNRVSQMLALLSTEVSLFLSPRRKFNHFSLKFWKKKKNKNIQLSIGCYLLIWADYYAHSRSLCTICKGKVSHFLSRIFKKIYLKYKVDMLFTTHARAFLTLLSLIGTAP